MNKYYLSLICLCAVFNVGAVDNAAENTTTELASLKQKINFAIIKVENTNKALWSYKISRYENEEGDISSSIEQHSPQAIEPWSLNQINGQAPTKKQIKKFVKKKQEQSSTDKKEKKSIQLPLRKLINSESLSLVSVNEKHIVMAFNVNINKLGKDSRGKLQGKLVYNKEQQFIEKITIWNNAEFSPMFTASITDLTITITFLQINGAVLLKQNDMKMKGSFAYFTEINETSLDSYSDYLYQGVHHITLN
ncbi:hypothetical protein [Colwellia psychrerythraea]|uniref:Uncharacterized protein n=1 Tax=Colwellia psychrerythraea TaxID=28229 RepID=A0A099L226_COLPS|nr:hypothetical protein [Colwellia psychrerythraea]KGJ95933.1 hypothetical protein GAB14E_1845 [Colwellia psychrerythraea]